MAKFSRGRDDASLPKIWTLFASLRARNSNSGGPMNKQAVVSKFSHVKPGDMEYFETIDLPPAVDKALPSTLWN